jgi:hypothetical protein
MISDLSTGFIQTQPNIKFISLKPIVSNPSFEYFGSIQFLIIGPIQNKNLGSNYPRRNLEKSSFINLNLIYQH